MISDDHIRMMARYNRWQNEALYAAANTLDGAARDMDCGAFWGSITGTLSHLLWGDTIWMSRFDGGPRPDVAMPDSAAFASNWADLCAKRLEMDDRIEAWAKTVGDVPSDQTFKYLPSGAQVEQTKPLALCITHFFNHQTHHRGQIHAMLTAAGAATSATDLVLMPDAG